MMLTSISVPAPLALFPNRPLRNMECTLLCLLLTCCGNPSQWTTCWVSLPPRGDMIVFLWLLIAFPIWRFSPPARRTSQQKPLPRSYLNEYGYILGSHKSLSHIMIVFSSAHSGQPSSHCWIPSSPNPLLSTPRQMAKLRSSIGWSYISSTCTIQNTPHTWDKILFYVQHSYNRALHSSTGHIPFQVGLGFQPLGPMDVALPLETTSTDSSTAPPKFIF
jgi:hypothetical protein